jgi:glutathione S-transferase
VYLDSRLILAKLEALPFPTTVKPPLGAARGTTDLALQRLLSSLTTGSLFSHARRLLPESLPLLKDPAFQKDRADFFGESGEQTRAQQEQTNKAKENAAIKAEALHELKEAFALLETTLLDQDSDNKNKKKEWLLGGDAPSLADIEAVWVLHWMATLQGGNGEPAMDPAHISRDWFPAVYAWIDRFHAAVRSAGAANKHQEQKMTGEEAARLIKQQAGEGVEVEVEVDETEPLVKAFGFKRGDSVEVWPVDFGSNHRDRGRLVGLTADEIVWETEGAGVRVHAPRSGFRVRPAGWGPTSL